MNTRCTAAPVCWFTKGYSLDSSTMRNVAEHVLNECAKQGIHIPAISFDGQWHTLAVRDETNQPLTKLQLQKDVWRETEVMKKQEILCEIRKCNKRPAWLSAKNNRDGIISYTMYNETGKHVPIISESVRKQRQHDIETLRKRNIADIQLNQNKTCDDEEPNDFRDTAINVDIQDTVDLDINIPVAETTEQINVNERITTSKHGGGLTEEIEENTAVQNNIQNKHDTACDDHITKRLHIDMDRATVILNMLKTDQHTNKRGIWNDKTPIDIVKTMQSAENLKTLRDTELKVVVRYLKRIGHPHLKESVNKACKLINICKVLGLPDVDVISENSQPRYRKRSRPNVVKSLQDIAFIELSKLRKADLNIIYAEYVWPDKLSKWQQKALVYKTELYHTVSAKSDSDDDACSTSTKSSGCDFFYIPSYSASRDQFEVSCVDSSHLLTRTRRKCCKGGLDGYSNAAWRTVAKSGNTSLSLPMIDCVVDQMSEPTAVTHFSEAVENEMIQNGYIEEALLCKDIRGWWRADDEPGIPASDRVELRMPIRQRLLSRKDIGTFPPPGMYVNGWPTVLWEAMLANIDAKTHLYSLTKQKTYNTRAFSSLVGETFFSEVTLFDRRGQGTVTASEFQSFIGTAIENLHVRLDNEKHFAYHTSKKHVYPLLDADDYRTDEADTASNTNGNRLPNHFFDTKERARVKGRNKEEHISTTRNAVQRGSLGVRWEKARRNDSKLLPTMKMGIDC